MSSRAERGERVTPTRRDAPLVPMDLDSEEALLGAMLLDPFGRSDEHIAAACEVVGPGDFYRRSHALVYAACRALRERGEPSDAITVCAYLERHGDLGDGARERVFELAALATNASNAVHYARLVRDASVRRGLVAAGEQISRLGYDGADSVDDLVEQAEKLAFDLATTRQETEMAPLADTVPAAVSRVRELYESGADVVGLPTGWHLLDGLTSGLHPGNLIVVAGRPSMGKTAFVLCLLRHTVLAGTPAGLFIMEMNKQEVTQRLLSMDGAIDLMKIRTGKLDREEWRRLNDSAQRLIDAPLHVEDAPIITPGEIRSRARRLARARPGLGLIVVDYLQLTSPPTESQERREREVAQASRSFKALAAELEVPVVVLSQLSRAVESRHDKRPMLSDLRESGAIEQDADLVMLLYRHEYYFPEEPETEGIAEVDVAKQRNGPNGVVKLAFVKRYARFNDLHPDL